MAIRINLLAEAQAAEELRRRDPIKKVIAGAVLLVLAVGCYCAYRQVQVAAQGKKLAELEAEWNKLRPRYEQLLQNTAKTVDAERKIGALQKLAGTRMLWATALNSLSQVMTNVNQVQVVRLLTDQEFATVPGAKAVTNAAGVVTPAKAPGTAEKVKMTITAKDFGKVSEENYDKLRSSIASFPYFKENLDRSKGISLLSLSPPGLDPQDGKSFVQFVLECQFADIIRY